MIDRIKNKLIWEGLYKPKYQKGKKCILMYHGIDQVENRLFNDRFFSADNFEEHLNKPVILKLTLNKSNMRMNKINEILMIKNFKIWKLLQLNYFKIKGYI